MKAGRPAASRALLTARASSAAKGSKEINTGPDARSCARRTQPHDAHSCSILLPLTHSGSCLLGLAESLTSGQRRRTCSDKPASATGAVSSSTRSGGQCIFTAWMMLSTRWGGGVSSAGVGEPSSPLAAAGQGADCSHEPPPNATLLGESPCLLLRVC